MKSGKWKAPRARPALRPVLSLLTPLLGVLGAKPPFRTHKHVFAFSKSHNSFPAHVSIPTALLALAEKDLQPDGRVGL